MKMLIGFILGVCVVLTAASPKYTFKQMKVEKINCDCGRYPDCRSEAYSVDTLSIQMNPSKLEWTFINRMGNKVKVTLFK